MIASPSRKPTLTPNYGAKNDTVIEIAEKNKGAEKSTDEEGVPLQNLTVAAALRLKAEVSRNQDVKRKIAKERDTTITYMAKIRVGVVAVAVVIEGKARTR